MTTTTTTTVKTRRWQRNAAGLLFVATLFALGLNAWVLLVTTLSFGTGGIPYVIKTSESAGFDTAAGGSMGGSFTEATVWPTDATFWPQAWLSLARILWSLVWITVALCVNAFSYNAYHGDVFTPRLPKLIVISAVAVGIGGSVADWIEMWGASTGFAEYLSQHPETPINSWSWTSDPTWTILAGLLLALLAVVFRSGLRLQRETEGLV
jgi:hypothetical protein